MSFWHDAEKANKASLKQLKRDARRSQRKGDHPVSDTPPTSTKPWNEMTDAEQKADIIRRFGKDGTDKRSTVAHKGFKTCVHTGEEGIFTLFDKALLFAAAKNASLDDPPLDTKLIIDLAGGAKPRITPWVEAAPEALASLKIPPRKLPDILKLNWPDRGIPRCDSIDWWSELILKLQEHYSGGRIIISCVGAHGRTGTALSAIVLASSPSISVEEAIKFVRKNHCEHAVESEDQVDYLCQFRPGEHSEWLTECASDTSFYTQHGSAGFQSGGYSGGYNVGGGYTHGGGYGSGYVGGAADDAAVTKIIKPTAEEKKSIAHKGSVSGTHIVGAHGICYYDD